MDTEEFWKLMDLSKEKSGGDPNAQLDMIRARLIKYTPEQIFTFACIQRDLVSNLMCKPVEVAYFAIEGRPLRDNTTLYAGDDGYWGFLYWLVAQGEQVYAETLNDPDYLSGVVDKGAMMNMELAATVADEVYFEKTGNEMPDLPPLELTEEAFEEEEALRPETIPVDGEYHREILESCPKLWAKFHEK